MILLFLSSTTFIVKAEPPIIVKGDVYINNVITEPEEVHLSFPDQSRFGTTYEDGRYIIIFDGEEPGSTGYFDVIYSSQTYRISEPIILEADQYLYNIDLYIETAGNQDPDPSDPDPSDPDPVDTNDIPKADAGGPYYEIVNIAMQFDGSGSHDPDGTITKYEWDFGDGTKSTDMSPAHTYKFTGKYQIKLTVTDNDGSTDNSMAYVFITETPNIPPNKPIIQGINSGTIETQYSYTIVSTDLDNDTIQYTIDWGDDASPTITDYKQNGSAVIVNHTWMNPGIFNVKVNAIDDKDVVSNTAEIIVLIDAVFCGDIGYMIDFTDDEVYDLFHSNTTSLETPVDYEDDVYFIDDDNDGINDYEYDLMSGTVSEVIQGSSEDIEENAAAFIVPWNYVFIAIIALVFFIIMMYVFQRKSKKKVYYFEKKEEKEIITPSKDNDIKSIEGEIDSLFSKKE